jgi:hypothetical protein
VVNLDGGIADCSRQIHPGLILGVKDSAAGQHTTEALLQGILGICWVLHYLQDKPKPLVAAASQGSIQQMHCCLWFSAFTLRHFLAQKLSGALEELKAGPRW